MNLRVLRHLIPQGFVLLGEPVLFPLLFILAFIWLLPHTSVPALAKDKAYESYSQFPSVKLDLHPHHTFLSRFPSNKTAIYLEPQKGVQHIVPLLLHMLEIIPPDWKVLFIGSEATTSIVEASGPYSVKMNHHFDEGRLKTLRLEDKWAKAWGPRWDDLSNEEMRSRLLTNKTFYKEELPGVEHLFTWTSDSILCANAATDLDAWLEWDWVGAPWTLKQRGSSGGLSLRRTSSILRILSIQSREDHEGPEDQWLGARISLIPNIKIPDREKMSSFTVEAIWHDAPMGYLIHHNMFRPEIWEEMEQRKKIFDYCPEIKIVLDMKLSRERCAEPPPEVIATLEPGYMGEIGGGEVNPALSDPAGGLPPASTPEDVDPSEPQSLPPQSPPPPPELEALIGSEAPMEEDNRPGGENYNEDDDDDEYDSEDGTGDDVLGQDIKVSIDKATDTDTVTEADMIKKKPKSKPKSKSLQNAKDKAKDKVKGGKAKRYGSGQEIDPSD